MKGYAFLITGGIFLSISSLWATDREELLFTPSGLRVQPSDFHKGDEVLALKSRVASPCGDDASMTCIHWRFVSNNPADEARYLPLVMSGINFWNNLSSTSVRFQYEGFSTTDLKTPYKFQRDADGNPTQNIALDEFGNPIIEGTFIISVAGAPLKPDGTPEFQFSNGLVSHTMKYATPNTDKTMAQIKWAGVYFNTNFQPGEGCSYDASLQKGTYNLRSVVAHEVGRLLGLSPSPNSTSTLFPLCPLTTRASSDDIAALAGIYPASNFLASFGSLSGRLMKGEDGSPLVGAQVHIVSSNHVTDLARKYIVATVQSRHDGKFVFSAIPEGSYILIAEPLRNSGLLNTDFDDWLKTFGATDDFSMEFYDGQGRESNQEAALGFSPQSAIYAANLIVTAGELNENVEVISNVGDPKIPKIEAKGATHEELSQYTPTLPNFDLTKENQEAANLKENGGFGLGGCEIGAVKEDSLMLMALLVLSLGLTLLLRQFYQKRSQNLESKGSYRSIPITPEERRRRLDKFRVRYYRFTNRA